MVFSDEAEYLSFCSELSFLTSHISGKKCLSLVLFTFIHLADALIQSHLWSFYFVDVISQWYINMLWLFVQGKIYNVWWPLVNTDFLTFQLWMECLSWFRRSLHVLLVMWVCFQPIMCFIWALKHSVGHKE